MVVKGSPKPISTMSMRRGNCSWVVVKTNKKIKFEKEAVAMQSAEFYRTQESESLLGKRTTGLTKENRLLLPSKDEQEPGIKLMYTNSLCKGTRQESESLMCIYV